MPDGVQDQFPPCKTPLFSRLASDNAKLIQCEQLVGRRIVHCQSSIRFYVNAVGEYTKDIQIRALDPEIFIDEEAATEVEKNSSSLASLNVGYEPW